jgi:hypothetical protein
LAKGIAPASFSWTAFVAANVAIDLEPLYHLLRGDYPIHGPFHTLIGATLTGTVAAALGAGVVHLSRGVPSIDAALGRLHVVLRSEFSFFGAILGGAIGGASHALLDSIVHSDVLPFAPWSTRNPLLGAIHADVLLDVLIGTGAIGLATLLLRAILVRRAG